MTYMIDEQSIHYRIEDDEADKVARLVEQRRAVAVEPATPPIPLPDAVKACQNISAQHHAAFDAACECEASGIKKCGMCE